MGTYFLAAVCSLVLAAGLVVLSARCLTAIQGETAVPRRRRNMAFLRKKYPVRPSPKQDWVGVVYCDISLRQTRDRHSNAAAFASYRYIQELLAAMVGASPEEGIANMDGKNFLVQAKMSDEEFIRNSQKFFADLQEYATRHGLVGLPQVHLGYYQGKSGQTSFDEAVRRARQACKCAAAEGQPWGIYDYGKTQSLQRSEQLAKTIRQAIREDWFLLEFQPFVDAATSKVVGGEVLSRMSQEGGPLIMPDRFLRAVDLADCHCEFDYYIFRKTCDWFSCHAHSRDLRYISCNFSRVTLADPAFVSTVISIADQHGLPHQKIALEITEEERVESGTELTENLAALRKAGFALFLDDFGVGYTSLADLRDHVVDIIKLDKSLLDHTDTERGRILYQNVVRLSKELGMKVLSEGVENEEELHLVRAMGCDLIQGYYYSRPLRAEDFSKLLRDAESAKLEA